VTLLFFTVSILARIADYDLLIANTYGLCGGNTSKHLTCN